MNRSTQFSFRLFLWMFYSRKLENRINWIHVRRNEEERNDGEMKGANIHPNLQVIATEMHKAKEAISPKTLWSIPYRRQTI